MSTVVPRYNHGGKSGIEHLQYPSDLRHSQIVAFKQELAEKVDATFKESKKEGYTTFLKHFSSISVAKIESRAGTKEDVVLEQLAEIRSLLSNRMGLRTLKGTQSVNLGVSALESRYVGTDPVRMLEYLQNDIDEKVKAQSQAALRDRDFESSFRKDLMLWLQKKLRSPTHARFVFN